jgi:hypothetical protein
MACRSPTIPNAAIRRTESSTACGQLRPPPGPGRHGCPVRAAWNSGSPPSAKRRTPSKWSMIRFRTTSTKPPISPRPAVDLQEPAEPARSRGEIGESPGGDHLPGVQGDPAEGAEAHIPLPADGPAKSQSKKPVSPSRQAGRSAAPGPAHLPQRTRRPGESVLREMPEQRVHRRRPRTGRPAYGGTDPHRATGVAAVEPPVGQASKPTPASGGGTPR